MRPHGSLGALTPTEFAALKRHETQPPQGGAGHCRPIIHDILTARARQYGSLLGPGRLEYRELLAKGGFKMARMVPAGRINVIETA